MGNQQSGAGGGAGKVKNQKYQKLPKVKITYENITKCDKAPVNS